MFKRVIWFSSGAASGAAGSWWLRRRIREYLRQYRADGLRDKAATRLKQAGQDAKTAVDEGRRIARSYRDDRNL